MDGVARRLSALPSHPAFFPCLWNFLSYSFWTLWNKRIFTRYGDYPLLSTGVQMVIVTLVVVAAQRVRGDTRETASRDVLFGQLMPLSLVRSADLGLANAALCHMSVAGQQILKATIPAWVCVLSIVYLKRKVAPRVWGLVALIVIGTAMATIGDPSMRGTPFGVIAMLFSCLCRAGKCVINTRLLQGLPGAGAQKKLSKLSLLRYEAPMSGACILVASLLFEGVSTLLASPAPAESAAGAAPGVESVFASGVNFATFMAATFFSGALMFLNQVTYLAVVEHTSPVASQALMNLKMIFLILLSSAFFPLHLSLLNGAGMLLAAFGAVMYSFKGDREDDASGEKHYTPSPGAEAAYRPRRGEHFRV